MVDEIQTEPIVVTPDEKEVSNSSREVENATRRREAAEWIQKNKKFKNSEDPKKREKYEKVKKVYVLLSQEIPESPYRKDFSVENMVKNFGPSLYRELENIATAVTEPRKTAKALGNVLLGTVQKIIPGEQDAEKYADALGKYYATKYGSSKAFLKYLEEEPAAVLGDISMFVTGGAGVLKVASKVGKADNVVGKVADKTMKGGAAVDPINLGLNTAGYGFGKALNIGAPHLASQLYQSSLKPSTSLGLEDTARVVKTGLDKDIPVSAKGIGELELKISDAGRVVDNLIEEASATGKTIPLTQILKTLDELEASFKISPKEGGAAAIDRIKKIKKQMKDDFKVSGKKELTAFELNEYKRSIYGEQKFNQRNQSGTNIDDQSLSAKGRGVKGILEDLDPRLQVRNRELGDLLQLKPELENAVNRLNKKDMIGIGAPIKLNTISNTVEGAGAAKKAAQIGSVLIDYVPFKDSIARIFHKKQTRGILNQYGDNNPYYSLTRNILSEGGDPQGGIRNIEDFFVNKGIL